MDFRMRVFQNGGIKLLSLGLAVTLWLYVTATGKTEMTFTTPLELRNIPAGMTVVGDVTSTIEVRVQGQEPLLRDSALGKRVSGIIDLSMAKAGENVVRLSPDDIRRPEGVMVTHLSPTEVKVKLEPVLRRTFRLRPVLHGAPAAGFHVASVKVTPAKISVEGPASVVKTFDKLETMPLDIQGAKESVTIEPKIDYQGKPVKVLDKNIITRIVIERARK
jgi:YbbR domain-containing protein